MPLDLSKTLVIGISATALFNLQEADQLFREMSEKDPDTAIEVYRSYMVKHENEDLLPGTAFPLVSALLNLNKYQKEGDPPLVEVVIMSRNSPETGVRVLKTIRNLNLAISRSAFTGGETVTDYLEAFDVDLFLTTNLDDAQKVIDSKVCSAALLLPLPEGPIMDVEDQVRIAFDGDAVLFDESSEFIYKTQGLKAFHETENAAKDIPLQEGPYAVLLKKLAQLQDRLPMRVEYSPVRIAIVTARNSPAELRVINTLRKWNVYADEAFFLGGVGKTKVLRAFRPHIFFDDQDIHLKDASTVVPSGKVLYETGSLLLDNTDEAKGN
jgi:5'-nucleotidase